MSRNHTNNLIVRSPRTCSRFKTFKPKKYIQAEWRVAFAFDPIRRAILLAAAVKGGRKESRIYAELIRVADARFAAHIATVKIARGG